MLVLACALVAIVSARQTNTSIPRAVVMMMSDDTGWGDVGYNTDGPISHPRASTPELDAWSKADSAVRFDRFYAGSPICSPTRASFLTGRTPWRDCIFDVEYRALNTHEADHLTLANLGRKKNFSSAHFGKWHLGSLDLTPVGGCPHQA